MDYNKVDRSAVLRTARRLHMQLVMLFTWSFRSGIIGNAVAELTPLRHTQHQAIFTARCYASAVLAMGLCPFMSVSVSVTSLFSIETAERIELAFGV